MQAADLLSYIKNPELLDKQSTANLQKLANEFPYFQAAHLLLSMSSKKWDASVYQQSLKRTAIVVTNRAHLFNLIQSIENLESLVENKQQQIQEKEISANKDNENLNQELNILKATEVLSENTEALTEQNNTLELETNITSSTNTLKSPEENLEKEIEKQIVNAFVEKEILKTHELHHPETTKKNPENFNDWLLFLKKNNGETYEKIEKKVNEKKDKNLNKRNLSDTTENSSKIPSKKEKQKALIDKIIETNPGLIKNKEESKFFTAEIKAKESLIDNEHLVTETLAKIYALQGNVNKAVRAYEILSLKFPQKSAYFATLINKLKNNQ
jgi:hypothetical protein